MLPPNDMTSATDGVHALSCLFPQVALARLVMMGSTFSAKHGSSLRRKRNALRLQMLAQSTTCFDKYPTEDVSPNSALSSA